MGLYADKESSKSGCHFLFIIYTNAISHEIPCDTADLVEKHIYT